MNEQNGATPHVAGGENQAVYANPLAFMELSRLNRANPQAVSVMLTLMSITSGNGVVKTTHAKVAKHCNSTLQQVEKAVTDLANAGWIFSVDASTEPGGPLSCFVNPDLVRAEQPDE